MSRGFKSLIGLLFTVLGIVGAFLPVLPSTCFFIFAAYFFAQSSPRLENWLLSHPRFGPAVVAWQQTRSISIVGKVAATTSMLVSGVLLTLSPIALEWLLLGYIVLVMSAGYVLTRPTWSPSPRQMNSGIS